MKELSIFVDESGDFGDYVEHSSYYIISMVLHDQENDISADIEMLERHLDEIGYPDHCLHAGPLIRNEHPYRHEGLENRQKLIKTFMAFFRKVDISCLTVSIEKKHIEDAVEAVGKLAKKLSLFIREHYDFFQSFDVIKIYYDNGQVEVSKILSSVFNALLPEVEFRKVIPSQYKLFQVADLLCTLFLVQQKLEAKALSKSELMFFGNVRDFRKNYLKPISRKEWL